MLIKLHAKTNYFFKFVLPFGILFQWALPTIENQIYINTNFGDTIYEKCNNPEHSHPPLSQRDTPDDAEKLANSEICNPFIINAFQNYFYITTKIVFEKPEGSPKLLFKHFSPARSPPFFEV